MYISHISIITISPSYWSSKPMWAILGAPPCTPNRKSRSAGLVSSASRGSACAGARWRLSVSRRRSHQAFRSGPAIGKISNNQWVDGTKWLGQQSKNGWCKNQRWSQVQKQSKHPRPGSRYPTFQGVGLGWEPPLKKEFQGAFPFRQSQPIAPTWKAKATPPPDKAP